MVRAPACVKASVGGAHVALHQHSLLPGAHTCAMESRSRSVASWLSSESWSMVMP